MIMSVYKECVANKELAAKVLLPLIEFEFSLIGDDSPTLVQTKSNLNQLNAVFKICKSHGWTNFKRLRKKGSNFYFRLTNDGLKEIYKIAGPFVNKSRNNWTILITERLRKKGGYMKDLPSTEDKIFKLMKETPKFWKVEDVCLSLRLTPSTIRKAFRKLNKNRLVERKKVGRSVLWKLK